MAKKCSPILAEATRSAVAAAVVAVGGVYRFSQFVSRVNVAGTGSAGVPLAPVAAPLRPIVLRLLSSTSGSERWS